MCTYIKKWRGDKLTGRPFFFQGNVSSPTITKGRGSSLLGGGLEFGILSVLASSDFPKIDLVKSPPSPNLPRPPKVDYGKLIIGIDLSQQYRFFFFCS